MTSDEIGFSRISERCCREGLDAAVRDDQHHNAQVPNNAIYLSHENQYYTDRALIFPEESVSKT